MTGTVALPSRLSRTIPVITSIHHAAFQVPRRLFVVGSLSLAHRVYLVKYLR